LSHPSDTIDIFIKTFQKLIKSHHENDGTLK
jgi:hypothetical protein